jgi:hypothetical protein
MIKSLIDIKLASIKGNTSTCDFNKLNEDLEERNWEWSQREKEIFIQTLDFIFKHDHSAKFTFIKRLDNKSQAYKLLIENFVKEDYPMLYDLIINHNIDLRNVWLRKENIAYNLLMQDSLNLNDYLKKYCKFSSKAISKWLGSNLVTDNELNYHYLVILQVLSLKLEKVENKKDIILSCLEKAKREKKRLINESIDISIKELKYLIQLNSVKKLSPWKLVLLFTDIKKEFFLYDYVFKDVLRMAKKIVDLNLEDQTIERKKLDIKVLHDNLVGIINSKGDVNFKIKNKLVSSKKINKYNKTSKKWKFLLPRTNREVYTWGNKLGHCIGTGGYAYHVKNQSSVLMGVYDKDKLVYTIEIETHKSKDLHMNPGVLSQIEGKSGIPEESIYQDIQQELKTIGIIK